MNTLISVLVLLVFISSQVYPQDIFSTHLETCEFKEDVIPEYQKSLYEFVVETYTRIGVHGQKIEHLVFSPVSTWIMFAAIAEAADPVTKQIMFEVLGLPSDSCNRLKYYQLATSRFVSKDDVNITSSRILVIDDGVKINSAYHNFVSRNSLLGIVTAPIRNDSQAALEQIKKLSSAKVPNLDLSGNSIIIDVMNYAGLWKIAFSDAIIEKSPFYSLSGEKIGTVDMMKVKRRAKMTYFEKINIKALELPVGYEAQYRMIFGLIIDPNAGRSLNEVTKEDVYDFMNSFEETSIPIDIAIPRVTIDSEFDVRKILEDYGVKNIWSEPKVTGNISDPAALPSGYIQRSSISLGPTGVHPPTPIDEQPPTNSSTGLDPRLGQDFIANKPFFFGLFDEETGTFIIAAAFTQPPSDD